MTKGKLYWTCGCARSGKSTFAQHWLKTKMLKPRAVVSGDNFRLATHGDAYHKETEPLVFAMMDIAIKALLMTGSDVLVDETATTKETVCRYLRIDMNAEPIVINASEAVCIERAIATKQDYLIPTIKRHRRQLDELLVDFDKKISKWREEIKANDNRNSIK